MVLLYYFTYIDDARSNTNQTVEFHSCRRGWSLQLLAPDDKKRNYVTARETQRAQRRHTKRTLLPTSEVLQADGQTDRHMCYLTVQTPDRTSVLVDGLVAGPQIPAGISASSSNTWNHALPHFQPPAVTNDFMNRPESFLGR